MDNETTVWSFKTARFAVELRISPCTESPADSFEFQDDIDAVLEGTVEWFDARVVVLRDGREIGTDSLGCCAYRTIEEFYTGHRDPDPMNRNSSIYRAARGDTAVICHYFPGMVRDAIAEARDRMTREPIAVYREFDYAHDAIDYRKDHGTGGWIFAGDNHGRVILFPPHMSPSEIFHHPLTAGPSGQLIGAA